MQKGLEHNGLISLDAVILEVGWISMEMVNEFQRKFGSRWTGVKFFFDDPPKGGRYFPKETRFCEAISQSWSSNSLLPKGCINCMGANYVFGWEENIRDKVIENFQRKRKISLRDATSIVKGLPTMEVDPTAIDLNGEESPDLLVAYLQPQQCMRLLTVYQGIFGKKLKVEMSNFAAICGGVAVEAYLTGRISLSFGCEDSRQYGGISRDRLIVGIPYALAHKLLV
ncbi:MAG: DUF169 domain-containing protein [Thermodesulfobacteriota bacterium]